MAKRQRKEEPAVEEPVEVLGDEASGGEPGEVVDEAQPEEEATAEVVDMEAAEGGEEAAEQAEEEGDGEEEAVVEEVEEEVVEAEGDDEEGYADELLDSIAGDEPKKKKAKAAATPKEEDVDDSDGEFDWRSTAYYQTFQEVQEMQKELAGLQDELRKAEEEGDDSRRMELFGYKGALQSQLNRANSKLQREFSEAEKQREDFAGQRAIRRQEKSVRELMKKTEDYVPSMKKHPAIRNTVEMIYRRNHHGRFAGLSGRDLEKAIIVYGMREGMIPSRSSAAKTSKAKGTAPVHGSKSIAGGGRSGKAPPSDGGKTAANGEVIPSWYKTEEDYLIARKSFTESELKEKYKGRNMVQA